MKVIKTKRVPIVEQRVQAIASAAATILGDPLAQQMLVNLVSRRAIEGVRCSRSGWDRLRGFQNARLLLDTLKWMLSPGYDELERLCGR